MKRISKFTGYVGAMVLCLLLSSGCMVVRRGAAKAVGNASAQLAGGFMYQDDLALVKEGTPAFLLMLDALAASHPDNAAILMAAADAQMAYATAFVAQEDKARAKAMYAKAKNYGIAALSKNKRFAAAVGGASQEAFDDSLRYFKKQDAPWMFSTSMSWVMWIIANSDSPAAFGDLPKVLALVERTRQLDPDVRNGGIDMFYGIYYVVMPLGGGRDLDKARAHFERSIDVAGADYLLNKVTYAEFYARYAFDEELFKSILDGVLAADPQRPEYTLMNTVAKQRAAALLEQMEDWF